MDGKISKEDVNILAKTIYGEARGSVHIDRLAVGFVIRNRAEVAQGYKSRTNKSHPLFGDGTLASACQSPWQFSCWNKNDPNCEVLHKLSFENRFDQADFRKSVLAALWVIEGISPDITDGCLHYHTYAMGWPKSWGEKKHADARFGAHLYYKHIDD